MRRRYVRFVPPETDRPTFLFVTLGAVAGAAAGLYLGHRYGTLGAFLTDVRNRVEDLRETWAEEDEPDDADADENDPRETDEDFDDEAGTISEVDDWDEDEEDPEDDEDEYGFMTGTDDGSTSREAVARRLEHRVLTALSYDRRLRRRAIEIAVVGDGVVELTGTVHAIEEISRAAACVRKVDGVAMVLNRLELRGADDELAPGVPNEPLDDGTTTQPTPPES